MGVLDMGCLFQIVFLGIAPSGTERSFSAYELRASTLYAADHQGHTARLEIL
jgi:hypothetical protein